MGFGEREVKNSITGDCCVNGGALNKLHPGQAVCASIAAHSKFVTGYVTGSSEAEKCCFFAGTGSRETYRLPFPLRILLK